MSQVQEIDAEKFAELSKTGTVLFDFWGPGCGPCRMQGELLAQMAEDPQFKDVVFAKINVYDAMDLAVQYQITSIPALFIFKNGVLTSQFVGVQKPEILKKALLG